MPIRPYLGSRVFEPELIEAMGEAFVIASDLMFLKRGQDDPQTRWVATCVIAAAEEGNIDTKALLAATLEKLGIEPPDR